MSNTFNARFDLLSFSNISADTWEITGTVIDNTGNFSSLDVSVGNIIYNDGSLMALGVLRYRILSIVTIAGSDITVTAIWDLTEDTPQEPITSVPGCISYANQLGVISLPDSSQQGIDVAFLNAVRNLETYLLSKKVLGISTPTDVMRKSTYDQNQDSIIDAASIGVIDPGTF